MVIAEPSVWDRAGRHLAHPALTCVSPSLAVLTGAPALSLQLDLCERGGHRASWLEALRKRPAGSWEAAELAWGSCRGRHS